MRLNDAAKWTDLLGWDLTRNRRFLRAKAGAVLRSLGWETGPPRITRSLLASSLPGRGPLRDELPLLSYPAIEWLARHTRSEAAVFEWGSGGSTLFLARRVERLVSVEHDPNWHERVTRALASRGLTNVTCLLQEPDPNPLSEDPSPTHGGTRFEAYVKAIDAFPDGSFDLVFVDGRARGECLLRALPKARSGGHLLLDDSQRRGYAEAMGHLAHLPREEMSGMGPYDRRTKRTTAWRVPE